MFLTGTQEGVYRTQHGSPTHDKSDLDYQKNAQNHQQFLATSL